MSKTYRFRHSNWKIKTSRVLTEWTHRLDLCVNLYNSEDYYIRESNCYGMANCHELVFNANSKEGKKRLAKFHSDRKRYYWNHRGPGWFHNLYSQRPYRRDAKRQIKRYIDNDIDVQLLRKPKREYWD
jgi:hypothetical protein